MTTYCGRWNVVLKQPDGVLALEQAERRHAERKPYCAVVERDGDRAVVEMAFFQAYCHVHFLDSRGRVTRRYSFIEVSDRLFLEQVTLHDYSNDGERPSAGEVFRFGRDGSLIHDSGKPGGPIVRREGRVDVADNYVPIPPFGDFDAMLAKGATA